MRSAWSHTAGIALSLLVCACGERGGAGGAQSLPVAASAPPGSIAVGPTPGAGAPPRAPRNPLASTAAVLQDGRRLYVWFNCAGCHGGHGGGGMGPSLRDERWIYGNGDAQIFDSIAAGRGDGMPAWGTTLPEQEIWKLVAYIQSLRTPDEPQPPR
ncbi:MAG: cytochrome c, class I [Proteobacteria bacterium]|nr:MAG: cytochrome c, class I [Pseudomonadota bacterium]